MRTRASGWEAFLLMIMAFAGCVPAEPGASAAGPGTAKNHVPQARHAAIDYSAWPAVTDRPFPVPENMFSGCLMTPEMQDRMASRGPHFVPAIKVYANPIAYEFLRAA